MHWTRTHISVINISYLVNIGRSCGQRWKQHNILFPWKNCQLISGHPFQHLRTIIQQYVLSCFVRRNKSLYISLCDINLLLQVAISSLMRILHDPSLSSYHQMVVGSLIFIFKVIFLFLLAFFNKILFFSTVIIILFFSMIHL